MAEVFLQIDTRKLDMVLEAMENVLENLQASTNKLDRQIEFYQSQLEHDVIESVRSAIRETARYELKKVFDKWLEMQKNE